MTLIFGLISGLRWFLGYSLSSCNYSSMLIQTLQVKRFVLAGWKLSQSPSKPRNCWIYIRAIVSGLLLYYFSSNWCCWPHSSAPSYTFSINYILLMLKNCESLVSTVVAGPNWVNNWILFWFISLFNTPHPETLFYFTLMKLNFKVKKKHKVNQSMIKMISFILLAC